MDSPLSETPAVIFTYPPRAIPMDVPEDTIPPPVVQRLLGYDLRHARLSGTRRVSGSSISGQSSEKKSELRQVSDSHALIRSRLLRENGKYIPKQSFLTRKSFFNNEERGFFKTEKRESQAKNPMTDPTMMTDMMKGNVTIVLPMIIIGGWINWAFSGFLTTKVPFPLTFRFKPMLQRGVELITLDASWVSSASWYFVNVFGLRSMYTLILGQDNAADQTRAMQDQMSGSAMVAPPDPMKAFEAEWEALEVVTHEWQLEGVEEELTGGIVQPETIYLRN